MRKFFAVQRFINKLLMELSFEVVRNRTHRERDKALTEIINRAADEWTRIVEASDDDMQYMDDIPF